MAPSGHHLGTGETFFPPSLFPFSCMVSRLESSTLTLLLTQPLRDGCNSSLSMAPVIEPSERENEKETTGEAGEGGKTGKREGGWCESRKEWNSIVISGLSQFWESVILLPYRWADVLECLSMLRLISSLIVQTTYIYTFITKQNKQTDCT